MQRFCLTLNLRSDPSLIAEYVLLHNAVWPEVQKSIRATGVLDMQIFRSGVHLSLIMDTTDDFTLERKAAMDAANPKVIEWERLMERFQDVDSQTNVTKRWTRMEKIFQLT